MLLSVSNFETIFSHQQWYQVDVVLKFIQNRGQQVKFLCFEDLYVIQCCDTIIS